MPDYPNFYENLKEAEMRLKGTVVLYDDEPYYVLCICDHKPDGIFRMYLDPIGDMQINRYGDIPWDCYLDGGPSSRGAAMDKWMDANKNSKLLRKHINSPLFNRFRPFPLGNVNIRGDVIFTERQPVRHTQQGLISNMISQSLVGLTSNADSRTKRSPVVDLTSAEFRATIKGIYPTAVQCLEGLKDANVTNNSVAFHREFSFVRGPIDTLFLAYKGDVVGLLPNGGTDLVKINPKFKYCKEVVENLNLFNSIKI